MLNFSERYSLANMLSWQHLTWGSLQLHLCSLQFHKAENTEKLAYTANQILDPCSLFKK